MNHATLVQEVAVDLGPVESAVRHLHFDEVTLQSKKSLAYRLHFYTVMIWTYDSA